MVVDNKSLVMVQRYGAKYQWFIKLHVLLPPAVAMQPVQSVRPFLPARQAVVHGLTFWFGAATLQFLFCVVCIRVWSVSVLLCSLPYVQVSIHSSFCTVLLLSLSWSTHAACFAHIDKKMWKTYCHQFVHSPVDVFQGAIRVIEVDNTPDRALENNPEGRARWWQGQDTDIDWFCAGWLSTDTLLWCCRCQGSAVALSAAVNVGLRCHGSLSIIYSYVSLATVAAVVHARQPRANGLPNHSPLTVRPPFLDVFHCLEHRFGCLQPRYRPFWFFFRYNYLAHFARISVQEALSFALRDSHAI